MQSFTMAMLSHGKENTVLRAKILRVRVHGLKMLYDLADYSRFLNLTRQKMSVTH
jgi:hypothetical protein